MLAVVAGEYVEEDGAAELDARLETVFGSMDNDERSVYMHTTSLGSPLCYDLREPSLQMCDLQHHQLRTPICNTTPGSGTIELAELKNWMSTQLCEEWPALECEVSTWWGGSTIED